MYLGFPKSAEFGIHLVEEELLLTTLPPKDIVHVKSRLFDNLVKEVKFDSVCILVVLLKLLDGLDLLLIFLVLVALGDLFFHLLGDLDETVVTLLHPLLLH